MCSASPMAFKEFPQSTGHYSIPFDEDCCALPALVKARTSWLERQLTCQATDRGNTSGVFSFLTQLIHRSH